jgi:hypothetical protein
MDPIEEYKRWRWLEFLRACIPDGIRVPVLRASTRRKIRRIHSEYEVIRQRHIKAYDAESDPEDKGFFQILNSEQAEIDDLQNALDEAETSWFRARAFSQRVPLPSGENWQDGAGVFSYRLKPEPLRAFKDTVIKAERETWKHRREWIAFIFAVGFGVVTAVSVFYNILSTQRKLNDIQGKLNDTQSVLADTQARLTETQRKLTDLTEQARRREQTTGKRGMSRRSR